MLPKVNKESPQIAAHKIILTYLFFKFTNLHFTIISVCEKRWRRLQQNKNLLYIHGKRHIIGGTWRSHKTPCIAVRFRPYNYLQRSFQSTISRRSVETIRRRHTAASNILWLNVRKLLPAVLPVHNAISILRVSLLPLCVLQIKKMGNILHILLRK